MPDPFPVLPVTGVMLDKNLIAYLGRTMSNAERHQLFDLNGYLMPEFNAVALYWADAPYKDGWAMRVHLYRSGKPGIYTVYLTWDQASRKTYEGKAEDIIAAVECQDWEASRLGRLSSIIKSAWGRVFG